jgi:hypothetical protein
MAKTKFYGEPNLQITVNIDRFVLNFDDKGEMILNDDNPAIERMKTHYQYEDMEEVEAECEELKPKTKPKVK